MAGAIAHGMPNGQLIGPAPWGRWRTWRRSKRDVQRMSLGIVPSQCRDRLASKNAAAETASSNYLNTRYPRNRCPWHQIFYAVDREGSSRLAFIMKVRSMNGREHQHVKTRWEVPAIPSKLNGMALGIQVPLSMN